MSFSFRAIKLNKFIIKFFFVLHLSSYQSCLLCTTKFAKPRYTYSEAGSDAIFRDTNSQSAWLKHESKLQNRSRRWKRRVGHGSVLSHTRFRKFRLIGQARGDRAPRSSRVPCDRSIDHSRGCGRTVVSFFSRFLLATLVAGRKDQSRNQFFPFSFWPNNFLRVLESRCVCEYIDNNEICRIDREICNVFFFSFYFRILSYKFINKFWTFKHYFRKNCKRIQKTISER